MNHTEIVSRKFLGKIAGFETGKQDDQGRNIIDKAERNYQQKHLKAYLKGHQRFQAGFDLNGTPAYHEVKQQYTKK